MSHDTLRADAQQNRDRILKVAHDAFARSSDASLNSIAKQAGVGAGTLYRHFPTREALLLAVYRHDVQTLVDSVTAAIAALLRSCADAGALRPDLEAGDVLLLMSCLWRVDSSDDGETQAARLFKLAVDGLRVVA
jgi:AcrR family transcriptional regulator